MSLQNKTTIKKNSLLFGILTLLLTSITSIFSFEMAIVVFLTSTLFSTLHLFLTYKRYKDIENLYEKLNLAITKDFTIDFTDYKEGELYILQSEIQKLVSRLKEHTQILKQDKVDLVDFLTDVSHQVRTPLTSISLILSLLEDEKLSPFERKQRMKEIEKLLGQIEWLISSLLKLSKLDANVARFQQERVSIQQLIKNSIAPIEIAMELKEQKLVLLVDEEACFIGDISWSSEAIGNILKNCMDHTPIGGTLQIIGKENALYTEIIIMDNGPGISEQDLPHLFERFYKGKSSKEGSVGVGLALARKIIANQNGTIKAENIVPHGAKFTIRLYKTVN